MFYYLFLFLYEPQLSSYFGNSQLIPLLLDLKNTAFPSNIEIPMKSSCPCITKKTKRDPKTTLRAPTAVHKVFNLSQIKINFLLGLCLASLLPKGDFPAKLLLLLPPISTFFRLFKIQVSVNPICIYIKVENGIVP